MARHKNAENETPEQMEHRKLIDTIADTATRGEKVSWDRKMDNMVSLLASLTPIENQILDLMAQKVPIVTDIDDLRKDMIRDCVHPRTHLTVHGKVVNCKFCNRTFSVVSHANKA